ncbi:tetratricopeptide repeat protein [Virgibacillus sp. FSP13]
MLIQQLTGKDVADIPSSPTLSWLPGKYAMQINRKKENIKKHFGENSFMIKCNSCGRKGKYDVGLMIYNHSEKKNAGDPASKIQTTGYFRCKHCNDAGNWEMPTQFSTASMAGVLASAVGGMKDRFEIGESRLYDGSWHLFSSDGEMHLLNKLKEDPTNSFIWNRLGNLYDKGNRPELAACVYEYSLLIDPGQLESHFTLGGFFSQMEELEKAAYHYKQLLLGASDYQALSPENLREMVAIGLLELFSIHHFTDGEIPFLPTGKELKVDVIEKNIKNLDPEKIETFYPFAEMYMGAQSKKLPDRVRTLKIAKPKTKKKKRWKKKKK